MDVRSKGSLAYRVAFVNMPAWFSTLGASSAASLVDAITLSYPLPRCSLAGAIGGAWMAAWGVRSTSVGVLSFLSVFPEQWGVYLAGEAAIFIITIVLTILLSKTPLNQDRAA